MTYINDIHELRRVERSEPGKSKMDEHYRIKREMEEWERNNTVTVLPPCKSVLVDPDVKIIPISVTHFAEKETRSKEFKEKTRGKKCRLNTYYNG